MIERPKARPPLPESLGLLWLLVLVVLALLFGHAPGAAPARATIALAPPRLVPLAPDQAARASRLLGGVAADAIAELEAWQ